MSKKDIGEDESDEASPNEEFDLFNLRRRPFLKLTGASSGAALIGNPAMADDHYEDADSEESDDDRPHVLLVGTGGTIANPEDPGFLTPDQLIDERPELAEVARMSVAGVSEVGSSQLTGEILFDIHDTIMEAAGSSSPPDGIVVSVGSNTVEEVIYFLNLTLKTEIPVVGTAAQRGVGSLGTDSDKNLFDAVRVAGHPDASGRGALLTVNDEIYHSRDVTKLVSSRPDGWDSPNFGRVGLAEDDIYFYRGTERVSYPNTEFDISNKTADDFPLDAVEILYSAIGTTGRMVDAGLEAGAEGFVDATLPTGTSSRPEGVRGQQDALFDAVDQGTPVVLVHRGIEGKITGGDGFIGGDTLSPQKARLLLALGIMEGCEEEELQELFDKY